MMRTRRFAALKHMVLILTSLFMVMFGAQSALAQQGQRMADPETRIKELISALEITAEQEPAFRTAMGKLMEEQRAAMRGAMQQRGGAGAGAGAGDAERREQRQAMMAANRERANEHLASVLTEAQLAKFHEQQGQPRRR